MRLHFPEDAVGVDVEEHAGRHREVGGTTVACGVVAVAFAWSAAPSSLVRGLFALAESPLRQLPNVILTSHTAWYSVEAVLDSRMQAMDQMIAAIGKAS